MPKKVLGKGLSALIPNKEQVEKNLLKSTVEKTPMEGNMLAISVIVPNAQQPRKGFDSEKLSDLTESIKQNGILQPIIVRKLKDNKYEVVAGERRLRAAKAAKLKDVPVLIKDVDDQKSLELALIENIQRNDLSITEEAKAYQSLMSEYQLTQEQLSDHLCKNRSSIANTVRLLQLPDDILVYLDNGKISSGHAKVLLSLKNPAQQRSVAEEIVKKDLSVRQTESWVKGIQKVVSKSPSRAIDPIIEILQTSLEEQLGTKVRLLKKHKGGKMEIEFYSDQDLERLLAQMNLSLDAIK